MNDHGDIWQEPELFGPCPFGDPACTNTAHHQLAERHGVPPMYEDAHLESDYEDRCNGGIGPDDDDEYEDFDQYEFDMQNGLAYEGE